MWEVLFTTHTHTLTGRKVAVGVSGLTSVLSEISPTLHSKSRDQSGWHELAPPSEEEDKCTEQSLYQRLACLKICPPPPPIPVEIGVQTWFCYSWPAALLRSSPFGLAMRLLQSPAVTLQRREFTVFLLHFLKHKMYFSSALQEDKNNRDCDSIWSLLWNNERGGLVVSDNTNIVRSIKSNATCLVVQTCSSFFTPFSASAAIRIFSAETRWADFVLFFCYRLNPYYSQATTGISAQPHGGWKYVADK